MILRVLVCIPTYNNPRTISQVVSSCLETVQFPILVVDDGSDKKVIDLLTGPAHRKAVETGRLRIIRNESNMGKGHSIQRAASHCLKNNFTHLFCMDADGQHLSYEIPTLVEEALKFPFALIIGVRRLVGINVPRISKFGRRFSNFWVKYQTQVPIGDSQSGFRIYPIFHLQDLKFFTKKFDFEIEVLIRLMWRSVTIREVKVDCLYPPQRVSHFNKWSDNFRITCLNAVFVALTLLRHPQKPGKIFWAVGLGVFVGCTPLFGLHTLLVLLVALLFRLNAIYLFLGSQVSHPFFVAPLIAAEVYVGQSLMTNSGTLMDQVSVWWLGSLMVGAVLGGTTGLLAYVTYLGLRPKQSSWTGRTRGGRFGLSFVKGVMLTFGLRNCQRFLALVIPYFYLFAPKARKTLIKFWRTMSPGDTWWMRRLRVLKHLRQFSLVLTDRMYFGFTGKSQWEVVSKGIENILSLVGRRGAVIVATHAGGWDLAAALLASKGVQGQFHMLQYKPEGLSFEQAVKHKDESHIQRLFYNRENFPIFKIREILAGGEPLGIMGDRPVSEHFELLPFFGKLAAFDSTPYRIAAATKSEILFCFGFRRNETTYDFFASQPRSLQNSGVLEVYALMKLYVQELEKHIRKHPLQWFNFFDVWSSEPQFSHSRGDSEGGRGPVRHKLIEDLKKEERKPKQEKLEWPVDSNTTFEKVFPKS